jgi:hypothetical protein
VANSSASTGVSWAGNLAAGRNATLNSAFDIWQRGTSISIAAASNSYTADRWQVYTASSSATTVSRQSTNDTTNLPNIQYCMRFQRNSGQTGTVVSLLTQSFETVNSIPYAGKTVMVSFYARKGADYSPTSSALVFNLISGTGTDQNVGGTYTGFSVAGSTTSTLTSTWQRFTFTATVPATATELGYYIQYTPTGTAGTNDYFEITGVQMETGSVATPFVRNSSTLQGELAACQRYYQVGAYGIGKASSSTSADVVVLWNNMRVTPSYSIPSYSSILLELGTAYRTPTGSSQNSVTSAPLANGFTEIIFTGASGMTTGNMVVIAGNTVTFSAEL